MIRVVQISTTESAGGAALAAHRLHDALNTHAGDVRSTMFVGIAQENSPGVVEFNPAAPAPRPVGRWLFRAGRRLQRRVQSVNYTLFSQDWTVFGRLPAWRMPAAEVSHLHWTADLVDFRMLPVLARRGPVVWTMHDMNPFTGGCHYDAGCGRFVDACGRCPMLGSDQEDDASGRTLRRKLKVLRGVEDTQLTLVSPSRWLAGEAARSRVFSRFECCVIPNGIDTAFFQPTEREESRRRVGLAPDDRAILFVAEQLDDLRKGWPELKAALTRLRHIPGLRLLTLGGGAAPEIAGVAVSGLGRLSEPSAIRDAYNAADVFVMPSLQDNFPNTVLEALACGLPIAGFRTGGVADAVEHEKSGLLAAPGDDAELAACLERILTDDALRADMSRAARERATSCFDLRHQADAYRALYQRLLHRRPAAPELAEVGSQDFSA